MRLKIDRELTLIYEDLFYTITIERANSVTSLKPPSYVDYKKVDKDGLWPDAHGLYEN